MEYFCKLINHIIETSDYAVELVNDLREVYAGSNKLLHKYDSYRIEFHQCIGI